MSEENNSQESFVNFMTPKKEDQNQSSNNSSFKSKTQTSLEKEREKDKEEKNKELKEAKSNSIAMANRYGKGNLMKAQTQNIIAMLPFILIGVVILLIVLFKGGDLLRGGVGYIFKTLR